MNIGGRGRTGLSPPMGGGRAISSSSSPLLFLLLFFLHSCVEFIFERKEIFIAAELMHEAKDNTA